jgi:hypothetical protein
LALVDLGDAVLDARELRRQLVPTRDQARSLSRELAGLRGEGALEACGRASGHG